METKIEESASGILRFQAKRAITNTYKEALIILEDLKREHLAALDRLRDSLHEEDRRLVDVANYWDNGKFESIRKRILTAGNNAQRGLEQQLDIMEVRFK